MAARWQSRRQPQRQQQFPPRSMEQRRQRSLHLALLAATLAEGASTGSHDGMFVDAVSRIHASLSDATELSPSDIADKFFPNSPLTIAPLAIVLATMMESTEAAILLAANIGGDSDSVASIAGGFSARDRPPR
jgi:hypothetical protein